MPGWSSSRNKKYSGIVLLGNRIVAVETGIIHAITLLRVNIHEYVGHVPVDSWMFSNFVLMSSVVKLRI